MINVTDGYAIVKVGGRSYELTPSFFNIAKIGTPKEIIETFDSVMSGEKNILTSFADACHVLECCGLPTEICGGIEYNEWQKRTCISLRKLPFKDVLILAIHCLKHGICGSNKQIKDNKESGSGEFLKEFNTSEYVLTAVELMGLSMTEAENLTMTKFIGLVGAKISNMGGKEKTANGGDVATKEQQEEAFAAFNR